MKITADGIKLEASDYSEETGLTVAEWTFVTDPTYGVQYGMSDSSLHRVGMAKSHITLLYKGVHYAAGPDGYVWFVPDGEWESAVALASDDAWHYGADVPYGHILLGWRIAVMLSAMGKFSADVD